MSTLASSRPQPLKLTIPSLLEDQDEESEEERRRRSGSSSSSCRRRSSTEVAAMHPDCLPLPLAQHGGGNSPQVRDEDCDPAEECEEQLNIEDEEEEADQEEQDLDLEDQASCCSETSVLSVGQEQSQAAAQAQAQVQAQARQRLLISQIYRPSAFSSATTTVLTPPADSLHLSSLPDDLLPSAAAAVGGSSFQEEFLRKSQLYAEELMKQQMHLMAAARVNALTAAAAGKQLQMAAMAAAAAAVTAPSGQDALAQLTATALGLGQAPHQQLLLQRDQVHHHHHHHLQNHHNNNENLHERALKFSIDNILKADFGSRLPKIVGLGGNSASGNATGSSKSTGGTNGSRSPLKVPKKGAGKPLNLAQSNAVNPSLSFSSSLANICSNSNDSNSTATSSSTTNTSVAPVDLVKSPPPAGGGGGGTTSGAGSKSSEDSGTPIVWPAWVYCTRYSDRPSSGPRTRKPKKPATSSAAAGGGGGAAGGGVGGDKGEATDGGTPEDKRPRTAFSGTQLARLKHEFNENRYLTEKRRQQLSGELGLNEAQIKIWFQNKRAKLKKSSGTKNPLALQLMAQGLYNHSTVPLTREEEEMQELQEAASAAAASKESC